MRYAETRAGGHTGTVWIRLLRPVLALQAVFLLGISVGSVWPADRTVPVESLTVKWRRAHFDPERELSPGGPAPEWALPGLPDLAELRGRPVALIFLGSEDGCGLRSLIHTWQDLERRSGGPGSEKPRVLFVARHFEPDLVLPCEKGRPRPRIALDPANNLARRYNATWAPRAFGIDAAGKIRYVQGVSCPTSEAPLELARVLLPDTLPASGAATATDYSRSQR